MASGTIVNEALSPEVLERLGAFAKLGTASGDFEPGGDWEQSYRIWTCHGYCESGNDNLGLLNLKRKVGKIKDSFTLQIEQEIVNDSAMLHVIDAKVLCLMDRISSVRLWRVKSKFIKPDGVESETLALRENGEVDTDKKLLTIDSDEKKYRRNIELPLTSDWSLFEALQRMDIKRGLEESFNTMEGLSVYKLGQTLKYRGIYPFKNKTLHWFTQIGQGVLPYDYYVDENHRLVLVTSGSRAYILDDNAEAKVSRHEANERK
jgi:hypothetical protein